MSKNADLILKTINNSNDHMTAEELFIYLNQNGNHISMATVYNNLNKLYEEGLIRKLCINGQSDRYDKLIPHDHLVCKKCGRLADFYFSDLTEALETQLGEKILSYDLKVDYICPECRKKIK